MLDKRKRISKLVTAASEDQEFARILHAEWIEQTGADCTPIYDMSYLEEYCAKNTIDVSKIEEFRKWDECFWVYNGRLSSAECFVMSMEHSEAWDECFAWHCDTLERYEKAMSIAKGEPIVIEHIDPEFYI